MTITHRSYFKKLKTKKPKKYNNVEQTYNGTSYDSKAEAQYAWELDCRKKAKDIIAWDRQIKIELYAYGKKICNYFVDFVIYHKNGTSEYIEIKGFETDVYRIKRKLMEAYIHSEEPRNKYTVIKV